MKEEYIGSSQQVCSQGEVLESQNHGGWRRPLRSPTTALHQPIPPCPLATSLSATSPWLLNRQISPAADGKKAKQHSAFSLPPISVSFSPWLFPFSLFPLPRTPSSLLLPPEHMLPTFRTWPLEGALWHFSLNRNLFYFISEYF